ncbi:MAG: hypothetical protein WCY62_06175 [Clostridia bacterium]
MTIDPFLYFDTDCISSFLWVKRENLLLQLYSHRVIIPKQVYDELGGVPHFRAKIDILINKGDVKIIEILYGTNEHAWYSEFTRSPKRGHAYIGRGEAAALALAKCNNGIVASNNLKDISLYVHELKISHVTTGDIMKEAMNRNFITEQQGNVLWNEMLNKKQWIGYSSFTEYLQTNR